MRFPVVDSVTPDVGFSTGGTAVTIAGRNFTGTISVSFGGVPAASFTVVDDNTITAVTPADTAGYDNHNVAVDLVNGDGSSGDALVAIDSSGNGNTGLYTDFNFGSGLVVGGDAGHAVTRAEVADSTFLDPASSFSVEYWYLASGTASMDLRSVSADLSEGWNIAAPLHDVTLDGVVKIDISGSGGFGGLASFNSETLTNTTPAPVDGAKHHFAFTYDGSNIRLYIDGSFIELQAGTAGPFTKTRNFIFGAGESGTVIDELAIYQSALSGGDIAANFAAAAVSYAAYEAQVLSLSPVAFYRFDDDRQSGSFTYFIAASGWYVGQIGMTA